MHVRAAVDLRGQRGQLEIVRGKQDEAAIFLGQPVRDRPCEREPIEGRRAASDFIDQHKTLRRRAIEDIRRFRHLDHERRAAAREIVSGADARVDRIKRSERCKLRRNEAPAARQKRDHGRLAHVGRFAAHVRARDDEQPAYAR